MLKRKMVVPVSAPVPINKLRQFCLSLVDLSRDTVNWMFDCPVISYAYVNYKQAWNYSKVWLAEKAAIGVAHRYTKSAKENDVPGVRGKWLRFRTRMTAFKFRGQAALCRYSRTTGTYKNL